MTTERTPIVRRDSRLRSRRASMASHFFSNREEILLAKLEAEVEDTASSSVSRQPWLTNFDKNEEFDFEHAYCMNGRSRKSPLLFISFCLSKLEFPT